MGYLLNRNQASKDLLDEERTEHDVHLVPFPFDPLRYVNDPRKWNGEEFDEEFHDVCRPNLAIGIDELCNFDFEGMVCPELTYADVTEDMDARRRILLCLRAGITVYPSTNQPNVSIMPAS